MNDVPSLVVPFALALAAVLVTTASVTASPAAVAAPATQAENTTVDYEGERLTLVSGPNATVTGETDLASGTNLTVRVRSSGESPFLRSAPATVSEDGAFTTTFNLTQVSDGTNATVTVSGAEGPLTEADARIAADPTPTPTVSPSPTPSETPPPTTSPNVTEDGTTPDGDTGGDGTGFGVVVGLLALVAAGLLAGRRG